MSRSVCLKSIAAAGFALLLGSSLVAAQSGLVAIFDAKTTQGWKNNNGKPLPSSVVQQDGLNPHGSGGYVVVHEKPYEDFVLDFDYKLSKGCNSGVFLRINDLSDPVMTGIEVALDDTEGHGYHDSGAFYDLVPPKKNTQKPAGQWNHMTITAKGANIDVVLNGERVSSIDLDSFNEPGKRDDGSDHKFKKVSFKELGRKGHLGFQDHGQNCWYKNIKVQELK